MATQTTPSRASPGACGRRATAGKGQLEKDGEEQEEGEEEEGAYHDEHASHQRLDLQRQKTTTT